MIPKAANDMMNVGRLQGFEVGGGGGLGVDVGGWERGAGSGRELGGGGRLGGGEGGLVVDRSRWWRKVRL